MASVRIHIHMQLFTHEEENAELQLRKQPPYSVSKGASRWTEQFQITGNAKVREVVVCRGNTNTITHMCNYIAEDD